jgi:hypothetical protein
MTGLLLGEPVFSFNPISNKVYIQRYSSAKASTIAQAIGT